MRKQRAGIDPFYVRKISELPEGSDAKAKLGIIEHVGNIFDGLPPGLELKSDGNIHYKHKGFVDANTKQQDYDAAALRNTYQTYMYEALRREFPQKGLACTLDDPDMYNVNVTLAAGVVANAQLVAPGAGKAFGLVYLIVQSDTNSDYTISLHATAGPVIAVFTVGPGAGSIKFGQRIYYYYVHAADNVDLECDVAGGAGAENLYINLLVGRQ